MATFTGGSGPETFTGGADPDTASGGGGNDILNGGDGDDQLDGGDDDDQIFGEGGNDTLFGGEGKDHVDGGAGNDVIVGAGAPTSDLYDLLEGGDGDDIISGGSASETINGGAGDDTIGGGGGGDLIDGGADNDTIHSGFNGDIVHGGAGNDFIDLGDGLDFGYGGDGDDTIYAGDRFQPKPPPSQLPGWYSQDRLFGEAGNDHLYFGAYFDPLEHADGGDGSDELILQGHYELDGNFGYVVGGENVTNVEQLRVMSAADNSLGHGLAGESYSYNLLVGDDLLATVGQSFTFDASGLGVSESFTLDASAETDASLVIIGGRSSDNVIGGGGNDSFLFQQGGADHVSGGAGNDGFYFGRAFDDGDVADVVDGGAGTDTLAFRTLPGSVSLAAVSNVEVLLLLTRGDSRFEPAVSLPNNFDITTADSTVAAGATLTVQASSLVAEQGQPPALGGESLTFDGSAETDGNFRIFAGRGNDSLTGGAGADGFLFGDDGNFSSVDIINGGAGTDTLAMRGNYFGARSASLNNVTNVEVVALLSAHLGDYGGAISAEGFDYEVNLFDNNVAAGGSIDINGARLGADETMAVDGRNETNGNIRIFAGAANDSLYGGAGSDLLYGGLGADRLVGGAGADTYVYRSAVESTSTGYDLIEGFDWHVDRIDAPGNSVRSFSQSAAGSLSTSSFDADLAAGMAGVLGAGQAALFSATSGSLAGQIFAVIDVNNIAGYQPGEDLVIHLATDIPIDPAAGVIV